MCDFIIAVLPDSAPHAGLDALARRHGRRFLPYAHPGLMRQLRGDRRCFLTTLGHCDCGTVLGSGLHLHRGVRSAEAERERLRGKGWSEARIARALADRQGRQEISDHATAQSGAHELAMWSALIAEVLRSGVREFGLLLHAFRGPMEEEIVLQGIASFAVGDGLDEILLRMPRDVLHLFRAPHPREAPRADQTLSRS